MRTETIYGVTRRTAIRRFPWACKIVKVEGGYKAFESEADYLVWRGQR